MAAGLTQAGAGGWDPEMLDGNDYKDLSHFAVQ
jgi:hypothetical protein